MTLTHILVVANLLLLASLLTWLFLLHHRTTLLKLSAENLATAFGALPRDLRTEAQRPGVQPDPFYTIEILNPMEVAAQESRLGRIFGGLTPAIVRREVYRQAHGIIRQQLADRGIKAEVKLHG